MDLILVGLTTIIVCSNIGFSYINYRRKLVFAERLRDFKEGKSSHLTKKRCKTLDNLFNYFFITSLVSVGLLLVYVMKVY